jgi:hypothetical protein
LPSERNDDIGSAVHSDILRCEEPMLQFELDRLAACRASFSGVAASHQRTSTLPRNSKASGTSSRGYRLMKVAIKIPEVADTRRRLHVWVLQITMKLASLNGPGIKSRCPWVKASMKKYSFDINKADQIFDFLLREKQIQFSPNHNIPSADELKNKKYCKWQISNSHSMNECKVFH